MNRYARTPQIQALYELRKKERAVEQYCPFCIQENSVFEGDILKEGKHFYVTNNQFPYSMAAQQILIIPYRHVAGFTSLWSHELKEWYDMQSWAIAKLGNCEILTRGVNNTDASIPSHLHTHCIQWR